MDVNVNHANLKRTKNRKRKRHSKVKRREQSRLEVRFAKRRKLIPERNIINPTGRISKARDTITKTSDMHANTFWENYEAAHEWQRRHSVEWWKSRCTALEQENEILRNKIRELASSSMKTRMEPGAKRGEGNEYESGIRLRNLGDRDFAGDIYEEDESNSDNNENLEFQVDEDMMKFFEHSIRHKLELKEKRDVEFAIEKAELEQEKNVPIEGGAAWMQVKTESAKLLYGISSPRILAMETALQATIDRHKDRAKPQYWPNIPLNL